MAPRSASDVRGRGEPDELGAAELLSGTSDGFESVPVPAPEDKRYREHQQQCFMGKRADMFAEAQR